MNRIGACPRTPLRCFRLSLDGAEPLWAYQGLADPGSSPVVVGDHVYVRGERRLACVNLSDGAEHWTSLLALEDPRFSSLVAADGKVYYAQEGIMWFRATPSEHRRLAEGRIDDEGLLATESAHRRRLGLDGRGDSAPADEKEAQRRWRDRIVRRGPLQCSSPAIAAGRLYLRRTDGVICYDLRAPSGS